MAGKDSTAPIESLRLSDVLSPAFQDCDEEQVGDAMIQWGQITGKIPSDWTTPDGPVTVAQVPWARLRTAAQGLNSVARLNQIINDGAASKPTGWMSAGMNAAIIALSDVVVHELERASVKAA